MSIRKGDYPSNSHASRERTSDVRRPRIQKVVSGRVRTRERSLGSRLSNHLTGGEGYQSILEYVLINVVLPGIKDLFYDSFMDGLHRALFGDGGGSRRRSGGNRGFTPYRTISESKSTTSIRRGSEERARPKVDGIKEIVCDSRGEAELILDGLQELIKEYDHATVADLYDAAGMTSSFTHAKWGWETLRGANVRRVRDGYLVDMPRPIALD